MTDLTLNIPEVVAEVRVLLERYEQALNQNKGARFIMVRARPR